MWNHIINIHSSELLCIKIKEFRITKYTIAHPWRNGHFTGISACGVWEEMVGVQVSKRELYTYIHLD